MKLPRIAIVATVAVLAAAAILAVGGGISAAHTAKYKSKVTINFQAGTYADKFFGKVKSKKAACKKKRTVKVFRKKSGPDAVFGKDKTNKKGKYVVAPGKRAKSGGKYYAKAKKRVLKNNSSHKHVCKAGTSPTITVP
jgi:hypothetical protein